MWSVQHPAQLWPHSRLGSHSLSEALGSARHLLSARNRGSAALISATSDFSLGTMLLTVSSQIIHYMHYRVLFYVSHFSIFMVAYFQTKPSAFAKQLCQMSNGSNGSIIVFEMPTCPATIPRPPHSVTG